MNAIDIALQCEEDRRTEELTILGMQWRTANGATEQEIKVLARKLAKAELYGSEAASEEGK